MQEIVQTSFLTHSITDSAVVLPRKPQREIQIAQVNSAPPFVQSNPMDRLISVGSTVGLSILGFLIFLWILNNILCICKPNEILIVSGWKKRKNKDGHELGYRVTRYRTTCIPILETVKRMDLTTMPVPVEVKNAYAKGGTPLNIQAIANVKISSNPEVVGNAIERFLDRDRKEIVRVARETLEGNLRGVVATLTPEELNEDRLRFAERITDDVQDDLQRLGLEIDTLKIQSVSDDVDYLSSIGRRQIAAIVRDAEIAESNALAEAEAVEAQTEQESEVAKTLARMAVEEKDNELRKIKAELDQQARSEEERTKAAAKEAQARAEQLLQSIRADLERLRLQADEVLPAEAARQAQELRSRGEAAGFEENAKAAAEVNDLFTEIWRETGTDAAEVFLIQQIEMVLREVANITQRVQIDRINVIDNGDGKSIASLVNAYPEIVGQFLDRVDRTLGIDVIGTLNRSNGDKPKVSAVERV